MALRQCDADKSRRNVQRAADDLSELLAQSVRALCRAQKQKRREQQQPDYDTKAMKEMTAILKDLASVTKTLEDDETEGEAVTGVVLLPTVDGAEEENAANG